jgi:hypothetical protein
VLFLLLKIRLLLGFQLLLQGFVGSPECFSFLVELRFFLGALTLETFNLLLQILLLVFQS